MLLTAEAGELTVKLNREAVAQATVAGTPLALFGLLGEFEPDAAALRSRGVRLEGDQDVAAAFARLLRRARPDLEEELSKWVGDVAAHQVGNTVRALGALGGRTLATLRQNASEFLQEEARVMPNRLEVRAFCNAVDETRDAVERAAARLRHLERRAEPAGD